jgi:hypothetical protein
MTKESAMTEDLRPAELHVLDRRACLGLLTTQRVGRLVVTERELGVVPVNYIVVDETVVFRVDADSRAGRASGAAAFEVDVIDDREHGGWSVLVRGPLEDITSEVATDPGWTERLEPWAPGPKDRWLRVQVVEATGRWLRGAEQPSPFHPRTYL